MSTWKSRVVTLVLLGLVTVFSIHLVTQWLDRFRVDLTEENLYSLSPGTVAILERMREEGVKPVDVTLFFSETTGKTLPKFVKDFITYERYLRNLLREYARASGGKIRVDFVDPVPDSDEAERATEFGLDGKLINQEGDLFFFGLAFETQTGSREKIEFLWPQDQESIEYEISKTLYRLLWPERKSIGVLSSLQVFGSAQDPFMAQMMAAQGRQPTQEWISIRLLRELYDVEQVPADTDFIDPEQFDLLLVIHPKDLPKKTLAAIDEWVVRGGNTLVLLDPYSIADQPPQNPQQPWQAMQYKPASDLGPLLRAWGIERPDNEFAADLELAVRRPVSQRGAAESVVIDLLIDEATRDQTLATDLPPLQGLSNLRFLLAGDLRPVVSAPDASPADEPDAATEGEEGAPSAPATEASGGSQLERTPVVTTTLSGGTLSIEPGFVGDGLVYTDFNNPAKLRDAMIPAGEPVVLAYLLRGRFPSAYPNGAEYPDREAERPPGLPPGVELPPPEDAEMIRKEPVPEEERGEATVVVFADVDFVTDALAFSQPFPGVVQAANDNHRLLLNFADYLLGSDELMAVRATKRLHRPFLLFDEIETAAERDTLERERQIRSDIEQFEQQLRDKQGEITARNASLLQKQLQQEVDELNAKIAESNRELREIRKGRREALEREESMVRFAVMGWMPILVMVAGIVLAYRRWSAR